MTNEGRVTADIEARLRDSERRMAMFGDPSIHYLAGDIQREVLRDMCAAADYIRDLEGVYRAVKARCWYPQGACVQFADGDWRHDVDCPLRHGTDLGDAIDKVEAIR